MKKLLLFLFCIPFLGSTQNSHTINTAGNTFDPSSLTINVGDTVTWNNTGGHHNINATQDTFPSNPEGFGNSVGVGWSFQWIFTLAGTYDYQCDPHAPGMSGVIIANALPIPGCTDSLACNYDSNATIDDGSCIYWGTSITTDTVCDSYVWSVTGDTLISSGIYTWVDNLSCDTNILNLTINNSTTIIDVQTIIGSYTWPVNGISYTSSIVDTSIGINSFGCSEMHILNLTILPFPDNLFFSEYAEGSSNNKYFEIYNPTSDTIDLTNYAFARVSNSPGNGVGVYEYWVDFDSAAIILPNDVFVVVHPSSDPFIIAEADMDYGSLSNGDDGFALVYGNNPGSPMSPSAGGYQILDWIGDWNGDPGSGWDVAGVSNATANHTLIRKCPISQGDTSWINAAGIDPVSSQWIVLANNDWTNIGFHNACVCDSSTNSYTSITDTICNGLSIVVGNNTYDSTGIYSDTLLAFNGCDSIITTNLTVLSTSASSVINDITICDGDSVVVGSSVYIVTGSYTDVLVNSAGCDSIITTNLAVQTPTYQDITICDGDSIVVGNSVYNSTGSYTDTITSSFGCDSIVHTNLTIYSQFNSIFGGIANNTVGGGNFYSGQQSLELSCYMPSELVSAVVYAQDTVVETFEIRDINGNVLSDTTVNVIPGGHRIYFNYLMSAGSDYELGVNGGSNDLFRHNSGVSYPYSFGSLAAVTSSSAGGNYYYFFYDIEVKQSSQPTNYSICDGESITVAGNVYNTTGLHIDSLTSSIGCDSLVFTNLVVHPNTPYTNNQTICSGETYLIGGNIYDSTGVYTDSLYTQYGCDSIVTTILVVSTLTGSSGVNQQTICFGDSVTVGSSIYFNTGIFSDTLISSNGCDSVVTTYLDVTSANYTAHNTGLLDSSAVVGDFSNYDGNLILDATVPSLIKSATVYAEDTNTVTFELRDDNGVVIDDVTHTVYPGDQSLVFNFMLPQGSDFELGVDASSGNIGLFRSNAGSGNSIPYPFDIGAVSITGSNAGNQYYYYYYDIEIMPLANYNTYSICEGDSIVVGANVYDATGNYTDYFVASNSCDSVVYTVLEVYQTPSITINTLPNPPEICLGDSLVIEVTQGFINYWWNTGNPADQDEDRVVVFPAEDFTYVVEVLDSNGCEARAEIFVEVDSCILGVDELSFEEVLQVYPNPASDQLTIDFTGNATNIKVYNMLGELMFEKYISEGKSSVQLFVKEWKGAIYSIQLYRENGTITHKTFTVVR